MSLFRPKFECRDDGDEGLETAVIYAKLELAVAMFEEKAEHLEEVAKREEDYDNE